MRITEIPASGPGALPGYEARCTCGLTMRNSLRSALEADIAAHANWHKTSPQALREIEQAEDRYNAYARQAEDAPHRWGATQEHHLWRLGRHLARLYNEHEIADFDRIQGLPE